MAGLFRQLVSVLFEEGGLLFGELGEILDEDAMIVEESFHAAWIAERQIPLDDQAIEARQNSGDFVGVSLYKRLHGVSLFFRGLW